MDLFTIGYEGLQLEQFIDIINKNNIKTIIDIRELALSRKNGFSKTALSNAMGSNNIQYYHFHELGSPRELRKELHQNKVEYDEFFQSYRTYVVNHIDIIIKALEIAENSKSALLCFEHDPKICHRSILAEIMLSYSDKLCEVRNI